MHCTAVVFLHRVSLAISYPDLNRCNFINHCTDFKEVVIENSGVMEIALTKRMLFSFMYRFLTGKSGDRKC